MRSRRRKPECAHWQFVSSDRALGTGYGEVRSSKHTARVETTCSDTRSRIFPSLPLSEEKTSDAERERKAGVRGGIARLEGVLWCRDSVYTISAISSGPRISPFHLHRPTAQRIRKQENTALC
ncbi:hypothetical protein MRX96_050706 [Rhipicephalus microplus]